MNAYEVEGIVYKARNEYDAVKQAYKMASRVTMESYLEDETWKYTAIFACGKANVIVRRVRD